MEIVSSLHIVLILTFGFALASALGYISLRIKLSPILGYLLAGYIIGPFSPGFVADLEIAEQLAELGVILMMFGVGLHFDWKDLLKVKNIAIPGALGQTFVATIVGMLLIYYIGWGLEAGIIIGLAIGVASTVVLVRMLVENNILNTLQGHISVGWLIVEDILTVFFLILIPTLANFLDGAELSMQSVVFSISMALLKFFLLAAFMFTIGRKVVAYILFKIARTRSQELFTVTVLALILVIALGSTLLFGTSIALGAFIAGMVIGQTAVKDQAATNSLPLKDSFVVIFFLSVGMLFNPFAVAEHPILFLGILGIILIVKPLAAFLITLILRYPVKIALTVAVALAQIGEFSFILSEEAMRFNLLPDAGYDIIVACSLVSISINPLLFKGMDFVLPYLKNKLQPVPINKKQLVEDTHVAIVIGYGPIGESVVETLRKAKFCPIVIDENVDTVAQLIEENKKAVYGDATLPNILKIAQIETANSLIITIPDYAVAMNIVETAKRLNPSLRILVRLRFVGKQKELERLGVKVICCEEESIKAFNTEIYKWAHQAL